jgi:hypothetical protein
MWNISEVLLLAALQGTRNAANLAIQNNRSHRGVRTAAWASFESAWPQVPDS